MFNSQTSQFFEKFFLKTMILFLFLLCFVFGANSLSECVNNRTVWNPPLWQLVRESRVRAFVLATTPLDLPDSALSDALRVAGASPTTYFMSLTDHCDNETDLATNLDDESMRRLDVLVRRMADTLTPATYATLFSQWRNTPIAILAQRLSIYSAVLYGAEQNDTAYVSSLFADAQLVPSTLDARLEARVHNCSRVELALETIEQSCHAYVGVYDDPRVKQSLVDLLLPELEAVLLRDVLPVRVVRSHQLSQAYRCGDLKALSSFYRSMGTDNWHEPLIGSAGDWFDEQVLFARNRQLSSKIIGILSNQSDDAAPPLFVIDATNLMAPDRFNHQRSSLKYELESNGFKFNLIQFNDKQQKEDQCESIPIDQSSSSLPSKTTSIIIYSVIVIVLVLMIVIFSIVIVRYMRRRDFKRNVIVV